MPTSRASPFAQLPHDLLQRVAALLGDEDRWGRPGRAAGSQLWCRSAGNGAAAAAHAAAHAA